jgi:DNA polymerase III subunit beta
MKFSVKKDLFTLGVQTVCKAISNRTTLPILENIYLSLDNEFLIMRGNDLELGIEYKLPVTVQDAGTTQSVLLKASTLNDILSKLSSEDVDLCLDDTFKFKINASTIDFEIFGLDIQEYPQFPDIEKNIKFNLKTTILLDLIKHTIFSVSHDETKQFLNGIKIESKGNRCDFISTDGFRLSLKYEDLDADLPEFSCIVPFKTMQELSKILTSIKSESLQLFLSDRQISFCFDQCSVVSRLISGRFPDYKQVVPQNTLFEFKVSRQVLLNAADRANIIASHSNYVARFTFSESNLTLTATNAKLGDYVETVDIIRQIGERDISVSFNIKLLQEALKIIDQQDILFEINSELSPCVIKPLGDNTYTHILMPIRMSEYSAQSKDASVEAPESEPVSVSG